MLRARLNVPLSSYLTVDLSNEDFSRVVSEWVSMCSISLSRVVVGDEAEGSVAE